MTVHTPDADLWSLRTRTRSPFQTPEWYAAAGWLERTRVLTDPDSGSTVPVWLLERSARPHYFHDPIELLTGHRETAFLDGSMISAAAARKVTENTSVLVTMSPFGYRGGALADSSDRDSLRRLADRMLSLAGDLGASMVLSHYLFDEDDAAWLDALTNAGGRRLVMGADAVLEIVWESLRDYHRWLGSSRRSLRQRPNIPDMVGLTWETREAPGLSATQRTVPELLARFAAGFDPLTPVPPDLLRTAAEGETMPRTLLSAGEHRRPARSVAVVLRRADRLYAKFFGSDDPRTDYFPLAYTRLITYAISRGFRRIEYGGGSHQAKLLRGARLRPAWGVLFILDEGLRARLEPLAQLVSERKLTHFAALANKWQVGSLPVHPAFTGGPIAGSSPGDSP